jgi:hypothetical protein
MEPRKQPDNLRSKGPNGEGIDETPKAGVDDVVNAGTDEGCWPVVAVQGNIKSDVKSAAVSKYIHYETVEIRIIFGIISTKLERFKVT